jgi:hypothetical protein
MEILMRLMNSKLLAPLCPCALAVVLGCSGAKIDPEVTGSTAEANVQGTVKVRGKLVTNGEVMFDPANINRPTAAVHKAPIGKDGKYSIKALVGPNTVTVGSKETLGDSTLQSGDRFVVRDGENTFDVVLPPPAQ